ncbi:PucR family transcriptional regulator [Streptomyces sp. KPB2]|uniref:PucR family transcriptional regulator n=1 Tax=Streptomyces TaxID=1883 RepID=UPI000F6DD6E6|nr:MULTISPECIES: helix-turn-helix domain-containing protein [Streptomyces]WST99536.1 helix-turn-helix domain-containing protein [Streptomyces sp. NBC_01124]AZM73867.1 PucR family transcriptional regulator [Streptomyces sp. KPB2]MBH5132943.1 helix-turn-helix domain-containing protein [Streptomyces sp. HB-N217]MDU0258018.1 helix-turn-helix domain-containing protein [Streptomyces sp. PU10]QKW59363.1 helix-turn-helix domain-containing protein [Streptomyces sp. NA03103]
MQHAVRSRAAIRTGLTPVPRPRTPGVTSLIDADALRVLHRAARTLLDDLPDLTDRLVALLQEQEPAYRAAVTKDAAATWQEAHRSLRHSVASLLDPRGARDAARRCSWRIGAARAEQGLPLDALLHAFRLGGSLVWQRLVEETSRAAPEDVRLLVHVAADVWNFVDEHCTLVADAYRQTEWQIGRRRENRARLLAAGLLDGTGRIADLPEAARALGLPEQGRYVVVAVTGGPPARSDAARAVAVPPGARVHWHAGPEVDYGIVLVGAVEGLTDPGPPASHAPVPGLRIGVGSPVEGLAAVGDARRLADTALDICPAAGGTVRLADQLPAALVVSSPELGRALAEKVLGPLLRLEPADREVLLDTLTTWLECDGSAQRAGERLYCHRNTVLNRLRRCEQLTGRSLARPADVVEFSLALTARRVLRD